MIQGESRHEVWFPCVGGASELAKVEVRGYGTAFKDDRLGAPNDRASVVIGVQGLDGLLRQAREGEHIERFNLVVAVSLLADGQTDLSGDSYSLAVALADRRVLYDCPESQGAKLVATGGIGPGGVVEPVGWLSEKAGLLQEQLRQGLLEPGDVFIYPAREPKGLTAEQRRALSGSLKALESGGLVLRPVEHLREVQDLWGEGSAEKPVSTPRARRAWRWVAAALGGAIMGLGLWLAAPGLQGPPSPIQTVPKAASCGSALLSGPELTRCGGVGAVFGVRVSYLPFQPASHRYGAERPLSSGATLYTKDQFRLRFAPPQAAHVYAVLVSEQTGGIEVADLMDLGRAGSAVAAGRSYTLPGNPGDAFVLDDRPGTERLQLLVLAEADDALEAQRQALADARARHDDAGIAAAQAAILERWGQAGEGETYRLEFHHLQRPASPAG